MSIFDSGFEEPDFTFPDRIILSLIESFEKATNSLASLNIEELDDNERIGLFNLNTTFQFRVILISHHLKGYSFEVFRFGYDVSIYPAIIILQSDIGEELKIPKKSIYGHRVSCEDQDIFTKAVESIFNSNQFKKTVGGLMKIARERSQNT